uniref:Ornithine decarboxylase antizyme 3 n=1 Tax=Rattus norvegicus TaxID=10116 RepID=M0RB36_RAT
MPCTRSRPSLYSLSYIKRGNTELPLPILVTIRLLPLLLQIPDHPPGEDAALLLQKHHLQGTGGPDSPAPLLPPVLLPPVLLPPVLESLEGLQVGRSTAQEKDHSQ